MQASSTFAIPKKNDTIHVISNLRKLNKRIKRKSYPISNIWELVVYIDQFCFNIYIYIAMVFYDMQLSSRYEELSTIVLPQGKCQYQSLCMGLASVPDIFQVRMDQLFHDMECVIVYMDDLAVSDWYMVIQNPHTTNRRGNCQIRK